MPRRSRKILQDANMSSTQPYDSALKGLMDTHASEIIPQLIPNTQVIEEKTVEIKRENMRADLVYLVQHQGKPHILNIELQAGHDSDIEIRILHYHVDLHSTYRLPVLSVILYLFETALPIPPYREMSGEKILLALDYQAIAAWKLDAQFYVREGIIGMYTFLPAMQNADTSLLLQAVHEMEKHYNRRQFGLHVTRFKHILQRSTTISEYDKQYIMEELRMEYDSLIDESPDVKKRVAKGAIKELQATVLEAVREEYPTLVPLAQQRVTGIQKINELRKLVRLIYKAPDEETVRWLLDNYAA